MSQNNKPKNPGANRQQRREYQKNPQQSRNGKPKSLRILALLLLACIVIGFVVVPIFAR